MNKKEIMKRLKQPFPPEQIKWRVGSVSKNKPSGMALAYIDARMVQERLDDIFGLDWQTQIRDAGGKTICDLSLKIDGEWITRSDGAGDTSYEADKGAISDSLKRAAVQFGVARYLYDLGSTWANLDNWEKGGKNNYCKISDESMVKLRDLLPAPTPVEFSDKMVELAKEKLGDEWEVKLNQAIISMSDGQAEHAYDPMLYLSVARKVMDRLKKAN